MCPDEQGATYLCIDLWIAADRAGPLVGDGRTENPYAEASQSRIQIVVYIANGQVQSTPPPIVSNTCWIFLPLCHNPLGSGWNWYTVSPGPNGSYRIDYSFQNSATLGFVGPTPIQGFLEFSVGPQNQVSLSSWTHTRFPSARAYFFDQGDVNVLGGWDETVAKDLIVGKMSSNYHLIY